MSPRLSRKSDRPRPKDRFDGEMYARPKPNPFSQNWLEAFRDGYDEIPCPTEGDKEYRDGYYTGVAEREYDSEQLGRTGSSNA